MAPLVGSGMGQKIGGDGIGVILITFHDLQKIEHGFAVIAGGSEIGKTCPVGRFLLLTAVLQRKGCRRGQGKTGYRRGQLPSSQKRTGKDGCKRRDVYFLGLVYDLRDMPADDVGDFMRENPGQLAFIFYKVDQPLVDVNISTRCRKRVDCRAPDD